MLYSKVWRCSVTVKQYHNQHKNTASLQNSAHREAVSDHPGVPLLCGICPLSLPVQLVLLFHGDKTEINSEIVSSASKKEPSLDHGATFFASLL